MFRLLIIGILALNHWPSIDNLPADYAGDPAIRRETQRIFLNDANGDPCLATKLWYECMIEYYAQHDPLALPEVDRILQETGNLKKGQP